MSKMLKILAIVSLSVLVLVSPIGCKKPPAPWESMVLSSIAALPWRVNVPVNGTANFTIDATYSRVNTGNSTGSGISKTVTTNLTYQSSNETIATVTIGGQVRGIAAGSANITVSYTEGNVTKTVNVPVTITAPPGT